MTLKQSVKKLRNDKLFQKIYNKWKKRRSRYEDKISLEDARKEALLEYYTLKEAIKYEQKPPENNEEPDYYVMVGGKSMLNSEWKRLMELQRVMADTSINPSPDWELLTVHYLKSLFTDDKEKPHKDRSVDLWDE